MKQIVERQRTYFYEGNTRPYEFRMEQLKKLKQMIRRYQEHILAALKLDLNKSEHEAFLAEIGFLHGEIDFVMKHLKDWMKDTPVTSPMTHTGSTSYLISEPYGVVLVISPWNYPIQLALAPAIGAIAAGNTVVIKPSEITENSSRLIHEMITETFPAEAITVVEGGVEETNALLEQKFDYIFFTGSTTVGKIIAEKAGKSLTPITLELGGKSPTIVDLNCTISTSAKRIVWGKFTNAGQTCIAPDYIYVHEKIYDKFLRALQKQITNLYSKHPLENEHFVRIVNERHFERLRKYLSNGDVYHGGQVNETTLTIEPTILTNVTWDDPIMQEEIFGPILPILKYDNLDDVIYTIQQKDKPLALYYFGHSKENEQKIFQTLSFGGGCVNDTIYHVANPYLPFGGVGASGMGAYHGKYSFDTFSHKKGILKQTTKFDLPIRYQAGKMSRALTKRLFS